MGVVVFTGSLQPTEGPGFTFNFEFGETWQVALIVALIVSGLATRFVAWRSANSDH